MGSNILPRICKSCGCTFNGGPRAFFCPVCRSERKKQASMEYKKRNKAGEVVPLGSLINCAMCGRSIVKKCGRQRFCPECAEKHLKQIDNAQSIVWNKNHPEKVKEANQQFRERRQGTESKKSGMKYISWDKESQKWVIKKTVNGKQIKIGRYKDLADAEKALNEFLSGQEGTE